MKKNILVVWKQMVVLVLIFVSIYLSGSVRAFGPFLHIEAFVLVFLGTFLLTWAVYPLKEIRSKVALEYSSRSAIKMGILTSMLDLMVRINAVTFYFIPPDILGKSLIKGIAFSLAGVFYGSLLSVVVLGPMIARANREDANRPLNL